MLVGSPGLRYIGDQIERFNSAQWLAPGEATLRYHKMHPVIFGEYVPGGEWFPWLYSLTPMPNGLKSGDTPVAMRLGDITLCPNICYENTVPHLIRNQVCQLTNEGTPPDALVTVTNDGWFWGSSQLDMHLACAVFRSVELRRPLLIAANTGFSASIDPHGQVVSKGPRRSTSVEWAELRPWRGTASPYQRWGDWAAMVCLGVCVLALWTGWRR
jgi:apolipoprotein N-acyltransferase